MSQPTSTVHPESADPVALVTVQDPPTPTDPSAGAIEPVAVVEHAASPAYQRALTPDLARGFMLLFIALANIGWYRWTSDGAPPPNPNAFDSAAQFFTTVVISSRSFPMFSFLFGYGMVQFYNARRARGLDDKPVRKMLWRRHWAIILFGLVHFFLVFEGDILAVYGLTGLLAMVLFFRRRTKTTAVWTSIFFALQLLGAAALAVGVVMAPDTVGLSLSNRDAMGIGDSVTNPNYFAAMPGKLILLVAIPAQVLMAPILPAVMLGWLAARRGILENPGQHRRLLTLVAAIGIPLAWLIALPEALAAVGVTELTFAAELLLGFSMQLGVAGALGYIAVFALLAERWQQQPPFLVRRLTAVGRRSMSSYLLQSIIFAPLLCAWGFGLGRDLGAGAAALIAIAVWLLSVAVCAWFDRQNYRGPAEVLLRRLTYGKYS